MRRATADDLPAITAFLRGRMERAMFPLSNLARFGLDGDNRYAPSMWFAQSGGTVTDVLTVGQAGGVMPAMPNGDWQAARSILAGRAITAVIGPKDEARGLIAALGIGSAKATLDQDEPHFALDLADLVVPEGRGALAPLQTADAEAMIAWRIAYCREALGMDPDAAARDGRAAYGTYVAAESHRVLMDGQTPLATTGFNAATPEMVQVGGVYTPPELRSRGLARRAVALHLKEAKSKGAAKAVLFSANEQAARAYRAIGFRQIGHWTLFLPRSEIIVDG